jgi:hypothetical protein
VCTLQAMIGIAMEHLKAKRKDKETLVQEKQARLEDDSPRLNAMFRSYKKYVFNSLPLKRCSSTEF